MFILIRFLKTLNARVLDPLANAKLNNHNKTISYEIHDIAKISVRVRDTNFKNRSPRAPALTMCSLQHL